jgi:hypothetical protein
MAVITPSTFDPVKRYVGVRLQQGVPIVDADWNELDDVLRFELRVLRRSFIGNGIPAGSDAFRIDGTGVANDFFIRRGVVPGPGATTVETGLKFAGHCLVDGLSVLIPDDIAFTSQPLHVSRGAVADAEAARLGVPKVAALSAPAASETLAVYLDVWERLLMPSEEPTLVLPALGTESCARVKREWVVRTRVGTTVPIPPDPASIPGHSYLLLATITRAAGQANVAAGSVTDRRVLRLSLNDVVSRLATIERLTLQPAFNAAPNQFAPKTGAVGQTVTLNGRNFNLGGVTVGFTNAAQFTADTAPSVPPTASQIQVAVPAGLGPGPARITVITEGGSTMSVESFNIL